MREYHNNFSNWADVFNAFEKPCPEKEPRHVFASYSYEDYTGSALVIVSNGRKFDVVEGAHCSCYGLEGQWAPTTHTRREIRKMLEATDGLFHEYRASIEKLITAAA
jgi:hypothetical protein